MSAVTDISTLIVSSPEIREGRPRIAGTGVTVHRVAAWYKLGFTPEEIVDKFGHLTLAQIYAALTYYHANQDQIEADLATDDAIGRMLEQRPLEVSYLA